MAIATTMRGVRVSFPNPLEPEVPLFGLPEKFEMSGTLVDADFNALEDRIVAAFGLPADRLGSVMTTTATHQLIMHDVQIQEVQRRCDKMELAFTYLWLERRRIRRLSKGWRKHVRKMKAQQRR